MPTVIPDPIVLPLKSSSTMPHGYLAAAVIANDEGTYLREWLEFHRLVGIEHVIFYDNGSTDNTKALLQTYIASGYVTYVPWSTFVRGFNMQILAYAHALCNFGPQWRWMAFIDLDEFLFPVSEDRLSRVLSDYEDLPAVAIPWHLFTFSGHKQRPKGLVIENYLERAQYPPMEKKLFKWKSIVSPNRVTAVEDAHLFILDGDGSTYTEDRTRIPRESPHVTHISKQRLRLNHYFTKSEAEYEERVRRGYTWSPRCIVREKKKDNRARLALEQGLVHDGTILRFLPELRRALEREEAPQRIRSHNDSMPGAR